ncbi:hypothetical protein D3C85_204110 [compost metagenome]
MPSRRQQRPGDPGDAVKGQSDAEELDRHDRPGPFGPEQQGQQRLGHRRLHEADGRDQKGQGPARAERRRQLARTVAAQLDQGRKQDGVQAAREHLDRLGGDTQGEEVETDLNLGGEQTQDGDVALMPQRDQDARREDRDAAVGQQPEQTEAADLHRRPRHAPEDRRLDGRHDQSGNGEGVGPHARRRQSHGQGLLPRELGRAYIGQGLEAKLRAQRHHRHGRQRSDRDRHGQHGDDADDLGGSIGHAQKGRGDQHDRHADQTRDQAGPEGRRRPDTGLA